MEEDEFFTVKLLFCDQDATQEKQSQDGQINKQTSLPIEEIKSFARISRNEFNAHLKSKGYKIVPRTRSEKSLETIETVPVHPGSHSSQTEDASTSSTRDTNPDSRDTNVDEDKSQQSRDGESKCDMHSKSEKSKKEKKRKKRKARAAEDVPAEKSQAQGGSGQAVSSIPQRESPLEQGSQDVCPEKSDETSSTCKSSKVVSPEACLSKAVEKTLPTCSKTSDERKLQSKTSNELEKVSATVECDVTVSQTPAELGEETAYSARQKLQQDHARASHGNEEQHLLTEEEDQKEGREASFLHSSGERRQQEMCVQSTLDISEDNAKCLAAPYGESSSLTDKILLPLSPKKKKKSKPPQKAQEESIERSQELSIPSITDEKWDSSSLPDRLKMAKHFDSVSIAAKLDTLPSTDQDLNVKKLHGIVQSMDITILIGDAGCGKTTAALMFVHYIHIVHQKPSFWIAREKLPENPGVIPRWAKVLIIDDFLGKNRSDVYDKWKECASFISEVFHSKCSDTYKFLLITRKSQIDALQAVSSAELPVLLDPLSMVQISTDQGSLYEVLKPYVDIKNKDLNPFPSIGFPLCCTLTPYFSPDARRNLFQQPRRTLHTKLSAIMNSSDIARLAYGLLALEGCVDIEVLQNDSGSACSLDKSFLESIQSGSSTKKTLHDIVSFYRERKGFVQIEDNCVSFVNESIRETILIVMCEFHAEVMAKHCSLPLMSQITLAARDFSQEHHETEKPKLSTSTRAAFLQRILRELMLRNYHEAFQSCLFEDKSFQKDLECTMPIKALVNQCINTSDQNGLHFLFYVGSQDFVLKSALSVLDKTDSWKVLQALLGCCYWGHANEIPQLLERITCNALLYMSLKEATVREIVTGDLLGVAKRRGQPNWRKMPIYPGDNLLTLAAWRGNDAVVRVLVEKGMDVNLQGQNESTALLHFCMRKNPAMVEFLLGKGADPTIANAQGWTPLMQGLRALQWNMPHQLISKSTVNARKGNLKPLSLACRGGWKVDIIRKILKEDDDPLYTQALQLACLCGQTRAVAFLLKQVTSNPEMKWDELLPLAISSPGRSELVPLLLKNPAVKKATDHQILLNPDCFLDSAVFEKLYIAYCSETTDKHNVCIRAARYGNTQIIKFLLSKGAPVRDAVNNKQSTCLHQACIGPALDVARLLVDKIDCNARTSQGTTPLMLALECGRLEVAKLLLEHGASLDIKDRHGNTCLHYAVISNSTRILKWCIEDQKMEINEVNSTNQTPLLLAQKYGCKRAEGYLQECGRVSGTT